MNSDAANGAYRRAIGESNYYYHYNILGSFAETALLAGVVYYAWTWPKTTDAGTGTAEESGAGTPVHAASTVRG